MVILEYRCCYQEEGVMVFEESSAESNLYQCLGGQVWMQIITEGVETDLYEGLNLDKLEKYDSWWNGEGQSVFDVLEDFFHSSFISFIHNFEENFGKLDFEAFFNSIDSGAWSDFIRETYFSQQGNKDHFMNYAVSQSLLIDQDLSFLEVDEDDGNSLDLPEKDDLIEVFGNWYEKSATQIEKIFNDVSPLISASGILSD
jgi:hypothetical protein